MNNNKNLSVGDKIRFKTESEFIAEFGENWRKKVTFQWPVGKDFLLGEKAHISLIFGQIVRTVEGVEKNQPISTDMVTLAEAETGDGNISGYKCFDEELKVSDFQFKVGDEYSTDKRGFRICPNPFDVFTHYDHYDISRGLFCSAAGAGITDTSEDGKEKAVRSIKIGDEIGIAGMIKAGIRLIFDQIDWSKESHVADYQSAASATGTRGGACAVGDESAARATGYQSAASATGADSAAVATGYKGVASATGNRGVASAMSIQGVASATGADSTAAVTGYQGVASVAGKNGIASATGDGSISSATGCYGTAVATGDASAAASATGERGIALAGGVAGRAKGALGSWIVCAEWAKDDDGNWQRTDVQCAKVDGEAIKADTYYTLKGGKFKKVVEEDVFVLMSSDQVLY